MFNRLDTETLSVHTHIIVHMKSLFLFFFLIGVVQHTLTTIRIRFRKRVWRARTNTRLMEERRKSIERAVQRRHEVHEHMYIYNIPAG